MLVLYLGRGGLSEIASGIRALSSPGGDSGAYTRTSRTARKLAMKPQQKRSHNKIAFCRRLHVITYRATLNVARELAWFVAKLRSPRGIRTGIPICDLDTFVVHQANRPVIVMPLECGQNAESARWVGDSIFAEIRQL